MENTGSYKRHEEGNWSPPQAYSETHSQRYDNSITSTPQTIPAAYFTESGSPLPAKEQPWEPYPPAGSPPAASPPPRSPRSPGEAIYDAPEVAYRTTSRQMSRSIPQGFWFCSDCRNSNSESFTTSHCSICGHLRCNFCRSAGQDFFEVSERQKLERPQSGGGTTLTSPHMPPYMDSFKEKVPTDHVTGAPEPAKRGKCGMSRNCFYLVLALVIFGLIALALGLGLGLTLGLKKSRSTSKKADPYCRASPEVCIGAAIDQKYYSTKGAFNGSGIALAGESWNKAQRKIFTLYFQHWTGDLRFMQYTTDKKWIGGTKAQTIATDAKNSTPISAVSYSVDSTQVFHIFYVSKNNTLRQTTMTNVSNIWESGPLSDLNLDVWDVPSVGLQACWKGDYYGDSDYSRFTNESGLQDSTPYEDRLGMNLWYPIDSTTFQQYAWYQGSDTWVALDKWQGMTGHAGVGCYSWGEGTTTYTMMVNKANVTEIWWKDTNTTLPSGDQHPINSWRNSSASIGPVYPSTSLGFTTYFYAQMADRSIQGFNVSFQAENTTIVMDDTFTVTDAADPVLGLGGTHLSVTSYAEKSGNDTLWDSLYVFYQTEGDDITAFTRPIAGGEWTKGNIKIPDE